jgi:hypothetical protein
MKGIQTALFFFLLCGVAFAGEQNFDAPGDYTFTVGAKVTSLSVYLWGGGGGGGGWCGNGWGGHGGNGQEIRATFAVTPGQVLQLTVGQGGPGACGGGGGGGGGSAGIATADGKRLYWARGGDGGGGSGSGCWGGCGGHGGTAGIHFRWD